MALLFVDFLIFEHNYTCVRVLMTTVPIPSQSKDNRRKNIQHWVKLSVLSVRSQMGSQLHRKRAEKRVYIELMFGKLGSIVICLMPGSGTGGPTPPPA